MLVDAASDSGATTRDARPCFCAASKLAVGLAAVALPFARSHPEGAERWLRILRVNGAVGNAMQAIGVPEHPLAADASPTAAEPCRPGALDMVIDRASSRARERKADAIMTEDLLVAVLMTYGPAFEHALAIRGTTSAEVLERVMRGRAAH